MVKLNNIYVKEDTELNNNTTIIAVCVVCLLMTMLFACSKGCGSKNEPQITQKIVPQKKEKPKEAVKEEKKEIEKPSSSSRNSGHGNISSFLYAKDYGTPPPMLTTKDKEIMKEIRERNRKKREEYAEKWFEEKLKDQSISEKTREQYLIKSNKSYVSGKVAMKHKDYKAAIKEFTGILKDDKASAVTKYFALQNLVVCAHAMKDLELFFAFAKMRGKLVATEDLSVLNIEKSDYYLKWCDKVEYALKVKDKKCSFDEAVQFKVQQEKIDEESAKVQVEDDIEYFSKMFKDFYL